MIEKLYGDFYTTCDGCGRELDGVSSEIQDALDSMKDNGWKSILQGGDWYNYCPKCAAKLTRPGPGEFAGL